MGTTDNDLKVMDLISIEKMLKSLAEGDFSHKSIDAYENKMQNICGYINDIKDQLSASLESSNELTNFVSEGNLDERVDTLSLKGGYAKILDNSNYNIDLTVSAFRDLGETVEKLSNGDMSARITNEYLGNLGYFRNIVNQLGENMLDIVNDANLASKAIEEGELGVRINMDKYKNDFIDIHSATNKTIDVIENLMQQGHTPVELERFFIKN